MLGVGNSKPVCVCGVVLAITKENIIERVLQRTLTETTIKCQNCGAINTLQNNMIQLEEEK